MQYEREREARDRERERGRDRDKTTAKKPNHSQWSCTMSVRLPAKLWAAAGEGKGVDTWTEIQPA